jgi:hypothetical protein
MEFQQFDDILAKAQQHGYTVRIEYPRNNPTEIYPIGFKVDNPEGQTEMAGRARTFLSMAESISDHMDGMLTG